MKQEHHEPKAEKTKKRRNIIDIKKLIIEALAQMGDVSTADMAKALGYARINNTINKAVRELIESGKIEYTEPDNPRSRNQKLRLVNTENEHDL